LLKPYLNSYMIKKSEILKSSEKAAERKTEFQPWESELTIKAVDQICKARLAALEKIRPAISLAYYNRLSEKLDSEKRQFQALLNIDDARKQFLAQYSLVLNPSYFEQKLWKI